MEALVIILAVLYAAATGIGALLAHGFFKEKPVSVDDLIQPTPEPVKEPEPMPEPVKPEPPPKTRSEKLYDVAYSCLGIDMAPTQDFVGCAEAVSFVLMKAGIKGLPKHGILSTVELDKWLATYLERVDTPEPGVIIMSPTGAGNGAVRGHVGIMGKHRIMSNNSQTSFWDDHWTYQEWKAYYGKKGGLPIKLYRLKG